MSDERCDLCGKLKNGQLTECQAGVDWNMGGMHACDDSPIPMPDGTGAEVVREALRAPGLRAALAEALDNWARWSFRGRLAGGHNESPDKDRIAEFRAKHLGRT